MEEAVLHQQVITALKQGTYTVKKSEPLSLEEIELDELGDTDSQDLDWIEIHVGELATVIEDFTVYYELKSLQPRKTTISDTEFDNDTLTFFDSEGIEAVSITEKDVIAIIKNNIRAKLLNKAN